jgi:hypothetical protein
MNKIFFLLFHFSFFKITFSKLENQIQNRNPIHSSTQQQQNEIPNNTTNQNNSNQDQYMQSMPSVQTMVKIAGTGAIGYAGYKGYQGLKNISQKGKEALVEAGNNFLDAGETIIDSVKEVPEQLKDTILDQHLTINNLRADQIKQIEQEGAENQNKFLTQEQQQHVENHKEEQSQYGLEGWGILPPGDIFGYKDESEQKQIKIKRNDQKTYKQQLENSLQEYIRFRYNNNLDAYDAKIQQKYVNENKYTGGTLVNKKLFDSNYYEYIGLMDKNGNIIQEKLIELSKDNTHYS